MPAAAPGSKQRPPIRAPLAVAAGALVLGIAAGRFAPLPTGFWIVLILAALGAAVITFRRRHLHPITSAAVAMAVGSLGAVHLRQNMYTLASEETMCSNRKGAQPSIRQMTLWILRVNPGAARRPLTRTTVA